MTLLYFLFFISFGLLAQTPKSIKVLPSTEITGEFGNQFRGCPENSECDQAMGLLMQKWKDEVAKLNEGELTDAQKITSIESFRSQFGIPTEFYTNEKAKQGPKPILHSSACKNHNPRLPATKTLRGTAFAKSITQEKAILWRDQEQIEVPLGELIRPQTVTVFYENPVLYKLAIGDQPLFIINKHLYILKEEDGFYFMLEVAPTGVWKIQNMDFSNLSKWEERRENIKCPESADKPSETFEYEFCKTVWDVDLKKTVIVKMQQGCAN